MLFRKLLLFSLLVIITEQLFYHAILKEKLPAFWGNEEVYAKVNYLGKHPKINAVFIGSSKVKTQIEPSVFDSVTNGRTTSFNLGCNGLFIPESFNIVDYILDSLQLKTIFYEIRPVYHIYKENLHITRTIYYHTNSSYWTTLQNAFHSNIPFARRVNTYATFTIARIENMLNFNVADGYISFKNFDVETLSGQYKTNGGCFIMGNGSGDPLKQSHAELDGRAAISVDYMKRYQSDSLSEIKYNNIYLAEIQRIIKKAKDKNVQLVLIFPSALREFEYREILPLLREIPTTPKFIIADATAFPDLYRVENNFETDHLNGKGAKLYSIDLGEAFNDAFPPTSVNSSVIQ